MYLISVTSEIRVIKEVQKFDWKRLGEIVTVLSERGNACLFLSHLLRCP